ncbi:MAG: flagellar hook-associated protein FlgK [Candidatus Eisenbacteria bacterium]
MISLSSQMEVARRALQTHQLAMSVVGTNIANVNTPGYSRRQVIFETARDLKIGPGMIGTGVDVSNIRRARDEILDGMFREHNGSAGRYFALQSYLSQVESVLGEPDGGGLSEALGAFWAGWEDLSNEPESMPVRDQLRGVGEQLTNIFHRLDSRFRELQQNLTEQIVGEVGRTNRIADRLAELNRMVTQGEFGGIEASGLRDERDNLIDELSEIFDIQVNEDGRGSVTVMIGSQVLVQDTTGRHLEVETGLQRAAESTRITWEGTDFEVRAGGGLLKGYVEARDVYIQGYIDDLDSLASGMVSRINSAHAAGFGLDGSTGNNFFDPDKVTAGDIRLDDGIVANLSAIAASGGGAEGDGQNAAAIAGLRTAMTMNGGRATFSTYYNSLTGRIGLDSREAGSFMEAEETLLLDVENRRMQVSGVSLDEEMSFLMSYQHAYEAMIRVTAAIDEMTVALIDMV